VHMILDFLVWPYLIWYNTAQLMGWGYALFEFGKAMTAVHWNYRVSMWSGDVATFITYFQWMMLLEIVHAASGMVRGDAFTAAQQVISRILPVVLLNTLGDEGILKDGSYVNLLIIAWAVTEVVRYSCYLTNLLNVKIWLLTYLRYTLFIFLYPMGVAGELGIWSASVALLAKTADVSKFVQGTGTVQENTYSIVVYPFIQMFGWNGIVVLYVLGFPYLYLYMIMRRKSVLAPKDKDGKKKPEAVDSEKKTK